MPVYQYRAVKENGEVVSGMFDAESARRARQMLRQHGLFVTEMRPTAPPYWARFLPFKRDHRGELLWMTRELHLLVLTGMPLPAALASLARSGSRGMRRVLRSVRDSINRGDTVAVAMARHPDWFPAPYVSMIRAGERSGELEAVLGHLTAYLQSEEDFRRQVQTALLYPKLVAGAAAVVIVVLMSAVVPRFVDVIARRGGRLPAVTRALQAVSGFLAGRWPLCLMALAAAWVAWKLLLQRPAVRLAWERALLRLPGIGPLRRKQATQRFAVMLCALLKGGVGLPEALQQVADSADSPLMAEEAQAMRERVLRGGNLAGQGGAISPPSFVDMLAAGQESGSLEAVLETVGRAYSAEVEAATKRVAALVEPAAILAVAVVVAFVVAAVLLPVFELSSAQ